MKLYDYLFYKFYKATRFIDQTRSPESRATYLGPLFIFCILEGLLLMNIIDDLLKLNNIIIKSDAFPIGLMIFVLTLNGVYFFKNSRWKRILKEYEGKEDEITAFRRGLLIALGVFLVIFALVFWSYKTREKYFLEKDKKEFEKLKKEYVGSNYIQYKYMRNEKTFYKGSFKNVLQAKMDSVEKNEVVSKIGERHPLINVEDITSKFPNGYLYEINGSYGQQNSLIIDNSIYGYWKIDSSGKIIGNFIINHNYQRPVENIK